MWAVPRPIKKEMCSMPMVIVRMHGMINTALMYLSSDGVGRPKMAPLNRDSYKLFIGRGWAPPNINCHGLKTPLAGETKPHPTLLHVISYLGAARCRPKHYCTVSMAWAGRDIAQLYCALSVSWARRRSAQAQC